MVESEIFDIPYPASPAMRKKWNEEYGLNAIYAGKHWTARRRDAECWHLMVKSAMNRCGCRTEPFQKPVTITFFWNDRLDVSNHAYMAKLIEDGMKGRIIVDDSQKYVRGIEHRMHRKPCILVVLREEETENAES